MDLRTRKIRETYQRLLTLPEESGQSGQLETGWGDPVATLTLSGISSEGHLVLTAGDSSEIVFNIGASLAGKITSTGFTGNAATVTNGLYSTGSYADPTWLTQLAWSKLSGIPASFTPAAHTHSADNITSGTLSYDRLPISSTEVVNWNTAYGWGNHALAGYALTSEAYLNPTWVSTLAGSKLTGLYSSAGLQLSADRLLGRVAADVGSAQELTAAQVKTLLALDLVNNTSDLAKPISTAAQAALDDLDLRKADVSLLSSNITLFPTTVASDISGYFKMVTNLDDPDYNDTAVNVTTGTITGNAQLLASLASPANLFTGNPGYINIVTIGNIRKTSGNNNQFAEFYFQVFKRASNGTETLIATSDTTGSVNPLNSNYIEFSATALLNNGEFVSTDRIVIKYYANLTGNSGATYDFQFGGTAPVRTLLPVPVSVLVSNEASAVVYDNTNSGRSVFNVQDAIDEAFDEIDNHVDDTTNPHSVTATQVGLGNVTNESKATMFTNPTFTGTVSGVTKSHVGLGNVDNTSDVNKPISTAAQTALDLKANASEVVTLSGTESITGPKSFTQDITLANNLKINVTGRGYLQKTGSDHYLQLLTTADSVITFPAGTRTLAALSNSNTWTGSSTTFTNNVTVSAAAPTSNDHVTRKDYVDTGLSGRLSTTLKGAVNGVAELDANGKVPLNQINDSVLGQMEYMGTWNASTNTPTLAATPAKKGDYYIVSTAGTQFTTSFEVGDWIVSNGVSWDKVDNTDAVSSVFSRTGNITAQAADYASFYVRHDTSSQGLNGTQQSNARTNIGAQVAGSYETAFSKGGFIQGSGVLLSGTLTNRLVNTGDVTIAVDSSVVRTGVITGSGLTQATARMLGRITTSTGAVEELTADQVRTFINVAAGAQVNVATNLTYSTAATTGTVNSSTGTNATIPAATTSLAGLMTNADKTKLDGIATSANNYSLPNASSTVYGGVKLGSNTAQTVAANAVTATAARTYAVQVNASGQMLTNVPWTDTVYTHPTGGANTTITAANGVVLSAITVNNLGHTTSVSSKTLAAADIPNLSTDKLTSGTLPVGRGGTGATTFTTGRILFGNGTSAINTDAALFWDNTNKRVSIGTTTPATTLDVNGDVTITDKIIHSGDTNTAIRFPANDTWSVETNGTEKIRATSTAVVVNESGLDQDFRVEGDTFANLVFVDASTDRVGINTGTPDTLFHVRGVTPILKVEASGSSQEAQIHIDAHDNSGTAALYFTRASNADAEYAKIGWTGGTSGSLYFTVDAVERMRITFDGNVGIGTTSPSQKLHVNEGGILAEGTSYANGARIGFNNTSSSNTDISYVGQRVYGGGYTGIGISDGTTDYLFIGTHDTYAGNVGIGTTSPQSPLSIYSNNTTTTPSLFIEQAGTGDATLSFSLSGGQGWAMGIDNSLSDAFLINNGAYGVDSSSPFAITTTGNVGIGTVSPATKLDVNGDVTITDKIIHSGDTNTAIRFPANDTVTVETGGEERVRVDSGGRFLVGRTSATGVGNIVSELNSNRAGATFINSATTGTDNLVEVRLLNYDGATQSTIAQFFASDSINTTTGSNVVGLRAARTGSYLRFDTNGVNERMRITSAGDVGIGTSSPAGKLTIKDETAIPAGGITVGGNIVLLNDAVRSEGIGGSITFVPSINTSSFVGSYSQAEIIGGADNSSNSNASGRLRFRVRDFFDSNWNWREPLTIRASGNVGIGTTSPSQLLTVAGNISGSGNLDIDGNATIDGTLSVGGALTSATLNTGQGANELYAMDQNVRTTDAVTFATVNTGQGATEVHLMNQNVRTTDSVTFSNITNSGVYTSNTTSTRDKIRVWNTSDFNIGMQASVTFGRLADYAMTFQMNNDTQNDRGFWWGDSGHTTAQGAMALTTNGNLTVANSIRVGYGESDTSDTVSYDLDVSGSGRFEEITISNALLSNQQNLDVDSGATRVIATIPTGSYDAAFFDFVVKKGTSLRAGTVYAVHNGTTVEFTETSTNDIGSTTDVTLSVDISGGNLRLVANTLTNDWIIKTLVRGL